MKEEEKEVEEQEQGEGHGEGEAEGDKDDPPAAEGASPPAWWVIHYPHPLGTTSPCLGSSVCVHGPSMYVCLCA